MSVVGTAGLRVDAFTYDLPSERIAQLPRAERDASRMLVATATTLRDTCVRDLPGELHPGDLLVGNRTRVRAARLSGSRGGGGRAEILVLERHRDGRLTALVRPSRKLPPGSRIALADGLTAVLEGPATGHGGARMVHLRAHDTRLNTADVDAAIEHAGTVPLPPYITAELTCAERYQTVFAQGAPRSAAASTAGLHITSRLLDTLRERGVGFTTLELDIGLGTFAPMTAERVDEHEMHEERYALSADAAASIEQTRRRGGRVVALGTTVVRVLETVGACGGLAASVGRTRLFIRPGHRFRVVDGLVTNFHQPRSSLLVLVAAFLGGERWRDVYAHALVNGYGFLSFGDCMLLWPPS